MQLIGIMYINIRTQCITHTLFRIKIALKIYNPFTYVSTVQSRV